MQRPDMTVAAHYHNSAILRHGVLRRVPLHPSFHGCARQCCLRLTQVKRKAVVGAADVAKTEDLEAFTTSDGIVESVEDDEAQVQHSTFKHLKSAKALT